MGGLAFGVPDLEYVSVQWVSLEMVDLSPVRTRDLVVPCRDRNIGTLGLAMIMK